MDTLRRANLLEVVNRVHQKVNGSNTSEDSPSGGESPDSVETPIDYSMMNRKRRLLDNFEGNAKKSLDYGSDGHSSDDRSSSGSPDAQNNHPDSGVASPNNLTSPTSKESVSSPELDDSVHLHHHNLHLHPRLQEMPMIHGAQQQQHVALQLFLQHQQQQQHQQQKQQQQQQHAELLQPFLRLSAMSQQHPLATASHPGMWSASVSPPPTVTLPTVTTPSSSTATLELARATHESQQKFEEFRNNLLRQIESSSASRSSKMRRSASPPLSISPSPGMMSHNDGSEMTPSNSGDKDSAYWERRRKNNEAAKRSRDARRAKEQEIALRAQFLEQENIQLKLEVAHLRAENAQLRGQFHHMQQLNNKN